jgi:hypothetical protein
LIDAWDSAASYRVWFDAARERMAPRQRPVYAEYGQVSDAFRYGRALQ